MKRFIFIGMMLTLLLCSCTNSSMSVSERQNDMIQDLNNNGMWELALIHAECTENLSSTTAVVQYNGEVFNRENNDAPQAGSIFLIMEFSIEKTGAGNSTFTWNNAYVETANGNKYYRHSNDTFLENYNLPRLKSTDLKIGGNLGFVCYEIPTEIMNDTLYFVYDGDEGQIRLQIIL